MLKGSFNQTEFFDTIRSLSYRRRQGAIEVNSGGTTTEILFLNGVIVEVRDMLRPLSVAIVAKLKLAGKISDKLTRAYIKSPVSVKVLSDNLIDGGIVSAEDFRLAKRAFELDRLHTLREFKEGEFKFTPRIVRLGHDFELNLSPGHLMLNMMELNQKDEEFQKCFGSVNDPRTFIVPDCDQAGVHSSESKLIEIAGERDSLKNIYNSALLCEQELRQVVSGLAARQLIQVDAPHLPGLEESSPPEEVEEDLIILRDLDPEEDNKALIFEAASQLSMGEEDKVSYRNPDGEIVEATDAEARAVLGDQYPHQLVGDAAHKAKKNEAWRVWAEAGQRSLEESIADAPNISTLGKIQNAIIALNFKLLEPRIFEVLSILVVLSFFLVLALFVPAMFKELFGAMEQFTASFSV